MKKKNTICALFAIISFICIITNSTSIIAENSMNMDEWTGHVRIEGKETTLFDDEITVSTSVITAYNTESGEIEEFIIDFPTPIGALDEASKIADFSYAVSYYPEWSAFLVESIGDDSYWWHYLIDYEIPMVGAGSYHLTEDDTKILWGFLEDWYVHALQISADKTVVKKNEEFIVTVYNESMQPVENALVYVGEETFQTDEQGNALVTISEEGSYEIFADKDDSVRSEKITINVQKSKNISMNILEKVLSNLYIREFLERIMHLQLYV